MSSILKILKNLPLKQEFINLYLRYVTSYPGKGYLFITYSGF